MKLLYSRVTYGLLVGILLSTSACTTWKGVYLQNKSLNEWEVDQWRIDRRKTDASEGWNVYARSVRNSWFHEFKITGIIKVTPDDAIQDLLGIRTERVEVVSDSILGITQISWIENLIDDNDLIRVSTDSKYKTISCEFEELGDHSSIVSCIILLPSDGSNSVKRSDWTVGMKLITELDSIKANAPKNCKI